MKKGQRVRLIEQQDEITAWAGYVVGSTYIILSIDNDDVSLVAPDGEDYWYFDKANVEELSDE